MYTYTGQCDCSNVGIKLTLPKLLAHYSARQCDCDFCTARGLCYLSDRDGQLCLSSQKPFVPIRQGSQQADFLQCPDCQQTVAVVVDTEQQRLGAVNAACILEASALQMPTPVSPKALGAAQKLARWQDVWMPVTIHQKA